MYRLDNKQSWPIYFDWAEHAPGGGPGGSIPVAEMRTRIKIADKLDKAMRENGEVLELEDSEFDTLKVCGERAAYGKVNRDAVAAVDALADAVRSS